jgi:hypothetical protein
MICIMTASGNKASSDSGNSLAYRHFLLLEILRSSRTSSERMWQAGLDVGKCHGSCGVHRRWKRAAELNLMGPVGLTCLQLRGIYRSHESSFSGPQSLLRSTLAYACCHTPFGPSSAIPMFCGPWCLKLVDDQYSLCWIYCCSQPRLIQSSPSSNLALYTSIMESPEPSAKLHLLFDL